MDGVRFSDFSVPLKSIQTLEGINGCLNGFGVETLNLSIIVCDFAILLFCFNLLN